MLRFDDAMHTGCGHQMTPVVISNPFLHSSNYFWDLCCMDADSQNLEQASASHDLSETSCGRHG
jgi:hypothetical protein